MNNIRFSSIDTKLLTNKQINKIVDIQKDMWAYGLGEYIKCNNCNEIHSKNDIFGHLSSEIRRESVTKLENIYLGDNIKCKNCNSTNTKFIYDIDENIKIFIERYKKESYLILSYNNLGENIGFCDGYISNLQDIFTSDLSFHYSDKNFGDIFKLIQNKLPGYDLGKMLYFSSLGTYQKYINYNYIYEMLRNFFNSLNNIGLVNGITELDKNNSLYKIYRMMGSISIGVDKILIKDTQKNYDSDICVFNDPINDFKAKYDIPFKQLIKKYNIK